MIFTRHYLTSEHLGVVLSSMAQEELYTADDKGGDPYRFTYEIGTYKEGDNRDKRTEVVIGGIVIDRASFADAEDYLRRRSEKDGIVADASKASRLGPEPTPFGKGDEAYPSPRDLF